MYGFHLVEIAVNPFIQEAAIITNTAFVPHLHQWACIARVATDVALRSHIWVRLMTLFSSCRIHCTFQHNGRSSVGMKLLDK